jgi:hypothetical protein
MCSMSREPRREECTICTAVAPEAVFTVRTYGTGPPYSRISAQICPDDHETPQVSGPSAFQAADLVTSQVKVKRNWLYDTVESEAIEAIRPGKQLRFRPSAMASYLIERAQAEKRT